MKFRSPVVLHPFLLAAYSVLSLYAHNVGELTLAEAAPLAGGVIAGALALYGLAWLAFRDGRKAGLVTTVLLLFGLFYGNLFSALEELLQPGSQIAVFFAMALGFGLLTVVLMRKSTRLQNATAVLNAMTLVLVFIPLINVLSHEALASFRPATEVGPLQPANDDAVAVATAARKPNVFFLIFDRYAASRTLRDYYAFDNRGIENYLRAKGFYVATESSANYLKTAHSLAGTFHMDYINFLSQQAGSGSQDWTLTYRMLGKHRVLSTFKKLGYRYIHLGSWWEPTRSHDLADENYNTDSVSELTRVFASGTIKPFFTEAVWPVLGLGSAHEGPVGGLWQSQCTRVPYTFDQLKKLAARTDPVFVFAHILIPHPPFLFDENGRCKSEKESAQYSLAENYVAQVKYANKLMRELIETLLASAEDPIIIIQADEGPFPLRYYQQIEKDWRNASEAELQIKFRILNAMYLPGVDHSKFYNTMSPVNTFRLVFDEYFGANLPLLEDRSYAIIDGYNHVYDFFEVTDTVR